MPIRNIVLEGDPCLLKKCRRVTDFNARLHSLLDDMKETLADAHGAGLAAPQVGVLRQAAIVVIDDGQENDIFLELINPEIIEYSGEQISPEGCLSIPGKRGMVPRPMTVKVRAQNRNGEVFEREAEGFEARAFCHEIDHLQGKLYTDYIDEFLPDEEYDEPEEYDEA